jgi:tRNA U34 2-thiouridine synthase MnmA/TrmU
MVKKAVEWIKENDFDFIITGEVVGQRPMSQRKETMPVIQRESGAGDLLLRPLCAKNLPETLPEREGWVDREKLLDFSGRSRKPQMSLAVEFNFEGYATPAGGCCFLTDKNYSDKLVDMWKHRSSRDYELDDLMMLKVGRHIRPNENFKMIVGREEGENKFMEGYRKMYPYIYCVSHNGPLTLIDGTISEADAELAASIAARFGQGRDSDEVEMSVNYLDGKNTIIKVKPMPKDEILEAWYV